ncbi:hypothetical protein ACFPYJ_17490 [Paenibacillus solisilvae]|uniref:Hydrolase n=1 Tax=Paenibacillus solisilvae TaxID=2486751 RepID=A0ABW0VZJ1_9BACL
MPQTYYVSISSRTIESNPSRAEQLTVEATEEELQILRRKLDRVEQDLDKTSGRAMVPYKSAERDAAEGAYGDDLIDLYAYVYRIGTPQTRSHIDSMSILPKLTGQNTDLPGYQ